MRRSWQVELASEKRTSQLFESYATLNRIYQISRVARQEVGLAVIFTRGKILAGSLRTARVRNLAWPLSVNG
jgi:hypothetical protein